MSCGSYPSFVHSNLCCCTLGFLTEFYGPVKSTLWRMGAMPNAALPQKEGGLYIKMSLVDTLTSTGWTVDEQSSHTPIKDDKIIRH